MPSVGCCVSTEIPYNQSIRTETETFTIQRQVEKLWTETERLGSSIEKLLTRWLGMLSPARTERAMFDGAAAGRANQVVRG